MSRPFGGVPTAVQISAASSSTMSTLSPYVPSFYPQFMSLLQFRTKTPNVTLELIQGLDTLQADLWDTGHFGNCATSSAWTNPDPRDMPEGQEGTYWFGDGAFTYGPRIMSMKT